MDFDAIVDAWLTPPRLSAPDWSAGGRLPEPERFSVTLPAVPLPSVPPDPPHPAYGAGVTVQGYVWDGSGPTALVVHGWGGSAVQLSAWIVGLRERGYRVVAFDAPAHGASGGAFASAPAFAGTIRAVSRLFGDGFDLIVAHSLGALAATLAVADGVRANRLIFLAPCCFVVPILERFGRSQGLDPIDFPTLAATFHKRFGAATALLDPLSRLTEKPPLTIVHDPDDAEVPFADAEAVAAHWPGASLVATPRVGHLRILGARTVIARTLEDL